MSGCIYSAFTLCGCHTLNVCLFVALNRHLMLPCCDFVLGEVMYGLGNVFYHFLLACFAGERQHKHIGGLDSRAHAHP
jgi:hypothetical protein